MVKKTPRESAQTEELTAAAHLLVIGGNLVGDNLVGGSLAGSGIVGDGLVENSDSGIISELSKLQGRRQSPPHFREFRNYDTF